MLNHKKSSENSKNNLLGVAIIILLIFVVGSSFLAITDSAASTDIASEIEELNRQVTTRRSQLENLKNKLATCKSQEFIMAQVIKYNLGLSASSRGQIKQISASMVSSSRFSRNSTVLAFTE